MKNFVVLIGVKIVFNQEGSFLWQVRVGQQALSPALFLLIRFNHVVSLYPFTILRLMFFAKNVAVAFMKSYFF